MHLFLVADIVTTSKALVPSSDALVTSFLPRVSVRIAPVDVFADPTAHRKPVLTPRRDRIRMLQDHAPR